MWLHCTFLSHFLFAQALCLYDYMKDYAGSSLFVLFKAIKFQVSPFLQIVHVQCVYLWLLHLVELSILSVLVALEIHQMCIYKSINQLDFLQSFRSEITALSDLQRQIVLNGRRYITGEEVWAGKTWKALTTKRGWCGFSKEDNRNICRNWLDWYWVGRKWVSPKLSTEG